MRPQTRTIGLILMAPLVIEFCASSMLVYNYISFGEDGSFSLSPDAFDYVAGTLGVIELVAVIAAVGWVLYTIFGRPPADVMLSSSASSRQVGASPPRTPDIMTVAEAAVYMRVTEKDVLDLIDQGRLGAARIGSSYRIARIAIDDFMAPGQT
ncbi:MAG: helix-turn-helix domain-containing protein [Chloroflexota bacterium]